MTVGLVRLSTLLVMGKVRSDVKPPAQRYYLRDVTGNGKDAKGQEHKGGVGTREEHVEQCMKELMRYSSE